MRVGWGFDAHRFSPSGKVLLAGVVVDATRGVEATSDGDVAAHAVIDALLGAAALGDLGTHYPSNDPAWEGADSMALLADTVGRLEAAGFAPSSVDVTVVAETVRVAPHRQEIRDSLAAALGLARDVVSVKATTTDGMGFLGADEGIAASAVAVVVEG
ncbi:MAG: 2-C-methyl-D-erythritol 2,4-cyclodiphosphate synthase [Acidimicrobiia bacterium]|nr:MAG: 2-C-methyl-D-erythritol 2,4-cyclodiphosphate synthase [Acidimicrobiia bacterium]